MIISVVLPENEKSGNRLRLEDQIYTTKTSSELLDKWLQYMYADCHRELPSEAEFDSKKF